LKLTQNSPTTDYKVALLSCPSLYASVKEIYENGKKITIIVTGYGTHNFFDISVRIFEYDKRFSAYGHDFVFYDLNDAIDDDYLNNLKSSFDLIIADPPFLSEDCISKLATIIKKLQKPKAKIICCSGEIVEPWLKTHLNLYKTSFKPEHQRNLGNEFASYANFNLDELISIKQ